MQYTIERQFIAFETYCVSCEKNTDNKFSVREEQNKKWLML